MRLSIMKRESLPAPCGRYGPNLINDIMRSVHSSSADIPFYCYNQMTISDPGGRNARRTVRGFRRVQWIQQFRIGSMHRPRNNQPSRCSEASPDYILNCNIIRCKFSPIAAAFIGALPLIVLWQIVAAAQRIIPTSLPSGSPLKSCDSAQRSHAAALSPYSASVHTPAGFFPRAPALQNRHTVTTRRAYFIAIRNKYPEVVRFRNS